MSAQQNRLNESCLKNLDLLGDQHLVEFVNDTISFYLKHNKVPFLSKYSEALHGAFNVVPIREATIEIIKLALRKTASATTLDVYKNSIMEWFGNQGLDFEVGEGVEAPVSAKTIDILATTIYARRNELQTILTDMILDVSADKLLIDYNYNLEMLIASSTSHKLA